MFTSIQLFIRNDTFPDDTVATNETGFIGPVQETVTEQVGKSDLTRQVTYVSFFGPSDSITVSQFSPPTICFRSRSLCPSSLLPWCTILLEMCLSRVGQPLAAQIKAVTTASLQSSPPSPSLLLACSSAICRCWVSHNIPIYYLFQIILNPQS